MRIVPAIYAPISLFRNWYWYRYLGINIWLNCANIDTFRIIQSLCLHPYHVPFKIKLATLLTEWDALVLHYICKQLATSCHHVSAKLSCCILLILILTGTAKFIAGTDTGIGISASLVPANSKPIPLFSSVRVRDDSHANDPYPVWGQVHKKHIGNSSENPITLLWNLLATTLRYKIIYLINFIVKPIQTKVSFDPII